jgi:broad specificity phosphatase PhoE
MEIHIIRHGPKEIVEAHTTGREASLDDSLRYVIHNYAKNLSETLTGDVDVDSLALSRNYKTAEIIADELRDTGMKVNGPTIDDRLGAFVGENGEMNLLSPDLPKIWGDAEKNYQNVAGVAKEDRGMYAWAEYGLDRAEGGISLRELACRMGQYVLETIEKDLDTVVAISNSGFIEPFMYVTLDMIEQLDKTAVEYFFETDGAVRPLEGITITSYDGETVEMTLPNGETIQFSKDVLREQVESLEESEEMFDQTGEGVECSGD